VTIELRAPAHRASRRARLFWTVRAIPGWLLIGFLVVAFLIGSGLSTAAAVVIVTAVALVALAHLAVMPQWRYRVHRWEITDTAVYTQSGWVTQERRIAPLARVQTVDTRRGPIEQLFGLSNVTVTTASSKGPVRIHALDRDVADRTVDWVTAHAQAAGGDGT
jgi:hypothetical protein